jgi:FkbM family methyltransferase
LKNTSIKQKLINIIGVDRINRLKSFFRKEKEDDPEVIRLRREFYLQFMKPGDTYFDVGANYGNRITPIVNENIRVVAIEPQGKCVRFLRKKFKSRITVVPKGAGQKIEEREFYISNASTLSTFSKDWIDSIKKSGRFANYQWNRTVKVQMTTLDKLIEEYGHPSFIKIDVEGYELEVLKGLTKTVPYISYEYAAPEQTENAIACLLRIQEISSKTMCNYSVGESMRWALNQWLAVPEMIAHMRSEAFSKTEFGDVYARSLPNDPTIL